MRLYTTKTPPYHFGTDLMSQIKMKDALTFQGSSHGCPLLFAVESKVCKVSSVSRGSSILYTNLNWNHLIIVAGNKSGIMFNSNTNQHTQTKKNINKQIFMFIKKRIYSKVIQPGLRYTLHGNNLFVLG